MRKFDFIVMGQPRGGTSATARYLTANRGMYCLLETANPGVNHSEIDVLGDFYDREMARGHLPAVKSLKEYKKNASKIDLLGNKVPTYFYRLDGVMAELDWPPAICCVRDIDPVIASFATRALNPNDKWSEGRRGLYASAEAMLMARALANLPETARVMIMPQSALVKDWEHAARLMVNHVAPGHAFDLIPERLDEIERRFTRSKAKPKAELDKIDLLLRDIVIDSGLQEFLKDDRIRHLKDVQDDLRLIVERFGGDPLDLLDRAIEQSSSAEVAVFHKKWSGVIRKFDASRGTTPITSTQIKKSAKMSDINFESIYLHIGHGKTGSSFVQSALALAVGPLAEHGIIYPLEPDVAERARSGLITSGNFWPREGAVEALVDSAKQMDGKKLLISSEVLFNEFGGKGTPLMKQLAALSVNRNVLLFLRSPVDHAVSLYQQQVKRGGATNTLADFLTTYSLPLRTILVLNRLKDHGFKVTIRDYNRHKKELAAVFENWIGLPKDSLPKPPHGVVNRSMTNAELELQRKINAYVDGPQKWVLSDALCNKLPDIKSEVPFLEHEALKTFIERMNKQMSSEEYQALVPEEERPRIGSFEDHAGKFPTAESMENLHISREQLSVIGDALGQELAKASKLRKQLKHLKEEKQKGLIQDPH